MRESRAGGRSLLFGFLFVLAACGGGGGGGGGGGSGPYIRLMALSLSGGGVLPFGFLQQAQVCSDSSCASPISTATVTVNGTSLTYDAGNEEYRGSVAIALGATVTAQIVVDGHTYTASGTQFGSVPTVSAPTSGETWTAGAHTISWTGGSPTAGAAYVVGIMSETGEFVFPGGDHGPGEIAIGTHSTSVPAGSLTAGSDQVMVGIGAAGLVGQTSGGISFSGAASGSGMWLGAVAPLVPVTVSGLPAAPGGTIATAGNAKVGLEWDPVLGATSYNVYWSTSAGVTKATGTKVENVTSPYFQTGLENGTTYHFVVTAVNGEGESAESAEMTATPSAAPFIQVTVLSVSGGGVPPFGFLQQARVCTDFTCSTPLSDATVTVNGTALSYDAGRSQFSGTNPISLGATVTAVVTIGAQTFTAAATQFSAAPTVSAPTSGAAWDSTASHTISWTGGAPTSGAAYVVGVMDGSGQFVFPAGSDHGPNEIAIATHSATVPANTLADGDDQVLVGIGTAGLVGQSSGGIAFSGTVASTSGMWLGAVAPLVPVTVSTPAPPPYIRAIVLTMQDSGAPFGFLEQVEVCTDSSCSTHITDATVQVNGTTLPWNGSDRYIGTAAISLAATVTTNVTVGSQTYTATGTQFTAPPTVSAPSSGATWPGGSTHTISWSGGAPMSGASYEVGVIDSNGHFVLPVGDHGPQELVTSTTSLDVPGGTLSAGDYQVMVGIGTTGLADQSSGGHAFSGAVSGSAMWLGAIASLVPLTVQ